jgi:hypothetical protein
MNSSFISQEESIKKTKRAFENFGKKTSKANGWGVKYKG